MNTETLNDLKKRDPELMESLADKIVIDEGVPAGLVEDRSTGQWMPAHEWLRQQAHAAGPGNRRRKKRQRGLR